MFFRNEYAFLSNMYPCEIKYKGMIFSCTEAAYQSQKTNNPEKQKEFQSYTGVQAKKMGRLLEMDPTFEDRKLQIMTELIDIKFSQPDLAEALMKVKGPIIEDNTWGDTFWGKCSGVGENHLGQILAMKRLQLLWKENSDEEALLNGTEKMMLGIYQMKSEEPLLFTSLKEGREVDPEMYDLVYTTLLTKDAEKKNRGELLESIFATFNQPIRPKNFHGRSLSISDIVVIRCKDDVKAYYTQHVGFSELPYFTDKWKA